MRLFDAIVLNEARILRTSVERSVYCKGARAWNSLPPTERNLPCQKAFKHHQRRNVKEITKNLLADLYVLTSINKRLKKKKEAVFAWTTECK